MYHSTLGLRVIKKKKKKGLGLRVGADAPRQRYQVAARILALGSQQEGHVRRHVPEREFCIDNLLVRIHFIIVMIRWTGLAPWEFEFPFPGSLTSTFLGMSNISVGASERLYWARPICVYNLDSDVACERLQVAVRILTLGLKVEGLAFRQFLTRPWVWKEGFSFFCEGVPCTGVPRS